MCYAVVGDEGLAVTVERDGELVLAEMARDMEAATSRAGRGSAGAYRGPALL